VKQADIHCFLNRFFAANECEIIENSDGKLVTTLTVDLDKQLMNRPFYWHYVEKTGGTPQPMTLTFFTKKKEKKKGEFIHFGSPRLHQIFQSAKKLASFFRLYEMEDASKKQDTGYTPLYPWLNINVKISYLCDRKKDTLLSLGLHLINGQIVEQFFDKLLERTLTPKLPDYCFPLTSLIKPQSGLTRLKKYIEQTIASDDHRWAEEAKMRWNEDLALLERFYEDSHDDHRETYENERNALREQYEPRIAVEVINGGIFYLKNSPIDEP